MTSALKITNINNKHSREWFYHVLSHARVLARHTLCCPQSLQHGERAVLDLFLSTLVFSPHCSAGCRFKWVLISSTRDWRVSLLALKHGPRHHAPTLSNSCKESKPDKLLPRRHGWSLASLACHLCVHRLSSALLRLLNPLVAIG